MILGPEKCVPSMEDDPALSKKQRVSKSLRVHRCAGIISSGVVIFHNFKDGNSGFLPLGHHWGKECRKVAGSWHLCSLLKCQDLESGGYKCAKLLRQAIKNLGHWH